MESGCQIGRIVSVIVMLVVLAAGCRHSDRVVVITTEEDGLLTKIDVDRQMLSWRVHVTNKSKHFIEVWKDTFETQEGLSRVWIRCRTSSDHLIFSEAPGVGLDGWWTPSLASSSATGVPVTLIPLPPGDCLSHEKSVAKLFYWGLSLDEDEFLRGHEFQLRVRVFHSDPRLRKYVELQTPWIAPMAAAPGTTARSRS